MGGKSEDLGRSHGFFVIVRGRLVNENDDRLGLHDLSHQTFNRFQAIITADDLDQVITAQRDGVGESHLKEVFQRVINETFNEARERYSEYLRNFETVQSRKPEEERNWVASRLMEIPIADALSISVYDQGGAEADENWMYLEVDSTKDVRSLIASLYSTTPRSHRYKYEYTRRGRSERLVRFNPEQSVFTINEDHELVQAYMDEPTAQKLLQDVITAEALFEVYLRESGVHPHVNSIWG